MMHGEGYNIILVVFLSKTHHLKEGQSTKSLISTHRSVKFMKDKDCNCPRLEETWICDN